MFAGLADLCFAVPLLHHRLLTFSCPAPSTFTATLQVRRTRGHGVVCIAVLSQVYRWAGDMLQTTLYFVTTVAWCFPATVCFHGGVPEHRSILRQALLSPCCLPARPPEQGVLPSPGPTAMTRLSALFGANMAARRGFLAPEKSRTLGSLADSFRIP